MVMTITATTIIIMTISIGTFVDILMTVFSKNSVPKLNTYFEKTLMYFGMIMANPSELMPQKVDLHYFCIKTNVSSVAGGIDLICLGPFSFSMLPYAPTAGAAADVTRYNSEAGFYMYSRVNELVKPGNSSRVSEGQMLSWMEQYYDFLRELSVSVSVLKATQD